MSHDQAYADKLVEVAWQMFCARRESGIDERTAFVASLRPLAQGYQMPPSVEDVLRTMTNGVKQ